MSTTEDRHVAKHDEDPATDTCTRCGEPIDAEIHVVNPTLHPAPQDTKYPIPEGAINALLTSLEKTGLSSSPAIVRKFDDDVRSTFEAALRCAAADTLIAVFKELGMHVDDDYGHNTWLSSHVRLVSEGDDHVTKDEIVHYEYRAASRYGSAPVKYGPIRTSCADAQLDWPSDDRYEYPEHLHRWVDVRCVMPWGTVMVDT